MAHGPAVEVSNQLADRRVQLGQREEPAIAQPGQHPSLHDLDSDFDLGFVSRPANTGRQNGRAVMAGHVLVRAADPRLIATSGGDAGLEVVADDLARDAAHAGERVDVAADPIRQRLRPARFGVDEVRGAERGNEDLRLPGLAGRPVDHRHGLPGVVHEQPFSRRMRLPHRGRQPDAPGGIEVTEPAVAVPLRLPRPVFLPHQQQRHAGTTQLGVDARPIRLRPERLGRRKRRREELALQGRVVEFRRNRPGDADHRGTAQILRNRVAADAHHRRDLAAAVPAHVLEAKDFSNLTHRQSLAWHGAPRVAGSDRAVG